jgi:hypothetical protein
MHMNEVTRQYHISIREYIGCNVYALHYTDGLFRLNTVTLTLLLLLSSCDLEDS